MIKNNKFWKVLFFLLTLISLTVVSGQQSINFVTYGANGDPKEGDNDFKQLFFIKVSDSVVDSFSVELFDVDCFGENDQSFRLEYNSEFKFSIYGGNEVFTANSITSESPSYADLYKGNFIKELITSNEFEYDNNWMEFIKLDKTQGELVDGAFYFKLIVEGLSGDDANVFNIRTVSKNNDAIKIINYAPTIHLLPRMEPVQMRFNSGENSRIIVKNYDTDGAKVSIKTPYRSGLNLKSSGDSKWESDLVRLKVFEKNEICAIQFGPGGKVVNDAIFSIKDEFGNPIPIYLPITTKVENNRPIIKKEIVQAENCNTFVFDASESYDNDGNEVSVKWVFPNGVVKTGVKEKMTFTNAGKHPIMLAIKDNSNAVESGSYQEFNITINELPKAIAGDDILRAPNDKIYFNAELSYDPDGWIKTYNWDFGNGSSASGKMVSHSYSKRGLYKVKLEVIDNYNGKCNSNVDSFSVWINAAPIANAGEDINCSIDEIINFDGSKSDDPDGHIISYEWDFGNGVKDGGKNVSHSFKRAGKYKIKLKVVDNSVVKNNTDIDEVTVWVNNPPIANAGKDIEVAVDELVTFDGSKSKDKDGELIEYIWASGDLFEKSNEVVSYSFTTPGKYEVKLRVKDNSGTRSKYDEDKILVTVNAKPIANAGDDVYQTNAVVRFDASGSSDADGEITNYFWDFGDGSSSSMQSVEHYYKDSGEYKVTLKVKDNSPASNNTSLDEIKIVINFKPIADAGPDVIVAPNENFKLSSSNSLDSDGDIILSDWYLENEIISNKTEFEYSFDNAGLYSLQLKVMDDSKHEDAIDFDNVTIKVNEAPTIRSSEFYKIAVNETVNFDASNSFDSDGSIEKYEWQIKNQEISNDSQFVHKFEESGNYKVTLSVTDNSNVSNSTSRKTINVFVNSAPKINKIKNINSCGNIITLTASEVVDNDGDILSYSWDLGDGTFADGKTITHQYSSTGRYPVLLTVDDGQNLSNSKTTMQLKVKINSAPIANAGEDEIICTGDIITLDASNSYDADNDLLKYEWDFGDSTFATGITVNKNYTLPGVYSVKLKVTDNSGLECNYSYDTKVLKVIESPVAFAGEDIVGCSNEEVFFNAYKSTDSDGIVNSFVWDFGDGNIGGGEKTSHVYKEAGVYNVLLTITGEQTGQCDNTDTDQLIVTIEDAPLAEFVYRDSVAVNNLVEFSASPSNGGGNTILSYEWDFGDGTTGTDASIEHSFIKSGSYIVSLTVTTDSKSGCNSSSIKKSIYINDAPIAKAIGNSTANINEVLTFDASQSYDPNGRITEYQWDFGDGTTKEGINVFHSYKEFGKFKVVLSVKDETSLSNNIATDEFIVDVNAPPTGEIEIPKYGFVGKPIAIKGENIDDKDGKIISNVWLLEGTRDSSLNMVYSFSKSGKHNVQLTITDDKNISTEISKSIMIYEIPNLEIDVKPTVCINENVILKTNYLFDNDDITIPIEWRFTNGKVKTGKEIETNFTNSGLQKINVVLISPLDNSTVLLKKEVEIYVNQAPVGKIADIENTFIGGVNDAILFDASESYDPDGNPLTYYWDMGDGNNYNGVKVFHTYMNSGNYTVTLTVSDNKDYACSKNVLTKIINIISR